MEKSLAATRVGGTISLIGVLTGGRINPAAVMRKSIRLQGVYVGSRRMFADLLAAYHALRAAGYFGKLVVRVRA